MPVAEFPGAEAMKKKSRPRNPQAQQYWIAKAHEARLNDPAKQAKIDAQAIDLLRERVAIFGEEWHVGCAIRLPAPVQEAIAADGTDVVLLLLDRDAAGI